MLSTRLSRALLAALAVAALATGSTLVTSDTAQAGRIDPAFNRGPPRIDPGIGGGPTRVDPGFGRSDSGPKYTVAKVGHYGLHSNCHWVRNPNWRYRNGTSSKIKVCF